MSFVIGIDADGVLTNLYEFNKKNGEELFKKDMINSEGYDAREMFGLTKNQEIWFVLKRLDAYCKNEIPREGCVEALQYFNTQGYELHSITARVFATRPFIGKRYQNMFKNWLTKNEINLMKSIQFCSEKQTNRDKYIACRKLKVDVMIEDSPDVSVHLANQGIKVALIDTPYNKKVNHKNIKRCKSYKEVIEFVEFVKENKKEVEKEFTIKSDELLKTFSKEQLEEYFNEYYSHLKSLPFDYEKLSIDKKRFSLIHRVLTLSTLRPIFTKVKNKTNIVYQDGMIIMPNHLNRMNQITLCYALRNRYLYEHTANSIKNTLSEHMSQANIFDKNLGQSIVKETMEINSKVINGCTTLISQENSSDLLDLKMLTVAQITKVPILPVAIYKKSEKSLFSTVAFGQPFFVETNDDIMKVKETCNEIIDNLLSEELSKV